MGPGGEDLVALRVEGASVRLSGRVILRGATFEVKPGEIVGIFGPSGAGKSTLFRAVSGECRLHEGRVRLGGEDVSGWPIWRRARAGLGYVPQGASVLFDLSVRDNLVTFARLCGRAPEPSRWAEAFGLGGHLDVAASALSGGERRRLELARALLAGPSVLLCDEPFAGLNPAAIGGVAALLRQAAEAGAAVVLTDHHLDEALRLSQRALLLLDGAVEVACPASGFAAHPLVRQRYFGADAGAFIPPRP